MSSTSHMKENKRQLLRRNLSGTLNKLRNLLRRLEHRSRMFSWYRLGIFIAGVAAVIILFTAVSNTASAVTAFVFIALFGVAAHFHSTLDGGIKRLKTWIKIKEAQIARMDLNWEEIPQVNYNEEGNFSPVEIDLNLTGDRSLHKLINTAKTTGGRDFLRKILNAKITEAGDIKNRQKLIRQLIPMSRFRERFILVSALSGKREMNTSVVRAWISGAVPLKNIKVILALLIILSLVNITLLVLFIVGILPAYWALSLLLYFAIYNLTGGILKPVFEGSEMMNDELSKLAAVFEYLGKNNRLYKDQLKELCLPFIEGSSNPSMLINKMESYTSFLKLNKNPFIWISIMLLFPIDHFMGLLIESVKQKVSARLDSWLASLFELEAMCSLANFAYLNPDYTFPVIMETNGEPVIKAEGLGHPLIKYERNIHNDLYINKRGEIDILTGSNMSGKSTLLRSVGTNIALAYAGGPVNASYFEVPLLDLFTCIKVSDSVTDGISYFYAEVKRLKELLDEIEHSSVPVFFLIDEIFRGTNNIERLAGSRAYIKALSASGAAGILATHDLELVKLEDEIPNLVNYHFKENVSNGKMEFDYKLRSGPCPTTNALKIMKMEGLPVD